jgi:hypothetical protein
MRPGGLPINVLTFMINVDTFYEGFRVLGKCALVKPDEDQMALHTQRVIKKSGEIGKRPGSRTRSAYVYAVLVDGIIRYVGKGRNGRMYSHLIEAKRSAARCSLDTSGLYPRMHRKLVEAVRIGSQVAERVVVSGLTDKAAYRLESWIVGEFHKNRAGQLWNTIDERFIDPRFLPDEWDDPEHPLYKLPRPLVRSSRPPADRKVSLDTLRKSVEARAPNDTKPKRHMEDQREILLPISRMGERKPPLRAARKQIQRSNS